MSAAARPRKIHEVPRASLEVSFNSGETIWTESSHKYGRHEALEMADRTGFKCVAQWVDEEWAFAENLFVAL